MTHVDFEEAREIQQSRLNVPVFNLFVFCFSWAMWGRGGYLALVFVFSFSRFTRHGADDDYYYYYYNYHYINYCYLHSKYIC